MSKIRQGAIKIIIEDAARVRELGSESEVEKPRFIARVYLV